MKYCKKCGVTVANPVVACPLCYAHVEQYDSQPELPSYPPVLQRAERYNLVRRILVLLSLMVSVICVTINALTFEKTWWSLIVVGNVVYMWVAIGTAMRRRSKLGYNLLIQVISLAALLVLIDRVSGRSNWALNYVVPFLLVTGTISISIITIVRRMDSRSFILYLFLTALLGFVPLLLLAVGLVTVLWPSLTAALYSGFSLVSLFVFADRSTKQELKRRFHL